VHKKLLLTREAAKYLNISVQSLQLWAKKNQIEFVRIGGRYFFSKETLDEILTPHAKRS
jgi:excisionase family DNA binding protein